MASTNYTPLENLYTSESESIEEVRRELEELNETIKREEGELDLNPHTVFTHPTNDPNLRDSLKKHYLQRVTLRLRILDLSGPSFSTNTNDSSPSRKTVTQVVAIEEGEPLLTQQEYDKAAQYFGKALKRLYCSIAVCMLVILVPLCVVLPIYITKCKKR
ncbi:hypothetical protein ABW19_dt0203823 [Dactylella cylindrospora]|nr:hypothetical protein ABW19_dt0203823 [Dactylella cylindrospora]